MVILADSHHIYGNMAVINHGQGVSTTYSHLSGMRVWIGERVEKEQTIGLMGATGQVTGGSHLHWGMVVNGVGVAPKEWIEESFPSPLRWWNLFLNSIQFPFWNELDRSALAKTQSEETPKFYGSLRSLVDKALRLRKSLREILL